MVLYTRSFCPIKIAVRMLRINLTLVGLAIENSWYRNTLPDVAAFISKNLE